MINKNMTVCALVACSAVAAMTQAEPIVYSDPGLGMEMGHFLPDFVWAGEYAPLDITLPASGQAGMNIHGPIPDNAIAIQFRAAQVSFDVGWTGIGAGSGSNDSVVSGDDYTVHYLADPGTETSFTMPSLFAPSSSVGAGDDHQPLVYLSANQTAESGFDDHWFVPQRIAIGVVLELDDGTHYGFAEFENVNPIGSSDRNYRPIRWGYESDPDVAMVVPAVCGDADTDRNGELDFFDVSAFLDAFSQQRFSADLNEDGAFDFFDVSDFLDAFGAGCP